MSWCLFVYPSHRSCVFFFNLDDLYLLHWLLLHSVFRRRSLPLQTVRQRPPGARCGRVGTDGDGGKPQRRGPQPRRKWSPYVSCVVCRVYI